MADRGRHEEWQAGRLTVRHADVHDSNFKHQLHSKRSIKRRSMLVEVCR